MKIELTIVDQIPCVMIETFAICIKRFGCILVQSGLLRSTKLQVHFTGLLANARVVVGFSCILCAVLDRRMIHTFGD